MISETCNRLCVTTHFNDFVQSFIASQTDIGIRGVAELDQRDETGSDVVDEIFMTMQRRAAH